jgi:hypothetical protein
MVFSRRLQGVASRARKGCEARLVALRADLTTTGDASPTQDARKNHLDTLSEGVVRPTAPRRHGPTIALTALLGGCTIIHDFNRFQVADGAAAETPGGGADVASEGPSDTTTDFDTPGDEDRTPPQELVPDTARPDRGPPDAPPMDSAVLDSAVLDSAALDSVRDGPAMDAPPDRPADVPAELPMDLAPEARDGSSDTACAAPRVVCAGAGCVDPRMDRAHCGACGRRCADAPHATGVCLGGACQVECERGWGNCDDSPLNGCEADLRTDDANCGACRSVCMYTPSSFRCVEGACTLGCPSGLLDCDSDRFCETTLANDHFNCGRCGVVCGPSTLCRSGGCVPGTLSVNQSCDPGRGPTCGMGLQCAVPHMGGGARCCISPGEFCRPEGACCGRCASTGRCCVPRDSGGCSSDADCCDTGDRCGSSHVCIRG